MKQPLELYWYDRDGNRFPTLEERAERLVEYLKARGIDLQTLG